MSNRFSVLGFVRTNIGVVSSSREECPSRFRKRARLASRQLPRVPRGRLEVLVDPAARTFVPNLAGCSLGAIEPIREASTQPTWVYDRRYKEARYRRHRRAWALSAPVLHTLLLCQLGMLDPAACHYHNISLQRRALLTYLLPCSAQICSILRPRGACHSASSSRTSPSRCSTASGRTARCPSSSASRSSSREGHF